MASPHVAGVAALIISRYGRLFPSRLLRTSQQTADPQACPSQLPAGYLANLWGRRRQGPDLSGRGRASKPCPVAGQANALSRDHPRHRQQLDQPTREGGSRCQAARPSFPRVELHPHRDPRRHA